MSEQVQVQKVTCPYCGSDLTHPLPEKGRNVHHCNDCYEDFTIWKS